MQDTLMKLDEANEDQGKSDSNISTESFEFLFTVVSVSSAHFSIDLNTVYNDVVSSSLG